MITPLYSIQLFGMITYRFHTVSNADYLTAALGHRALGIPQAFLGKIKAALQELVTQLANNLFAQAALHSPKLVCMPSF